MVLTLSAAEEVTNEADATSDTDEAAVVPEPETVDTDVEQDDDALSETLSEENQSSRTENETVTEDNGSGEEVSSETAQEVFTEEISTEETPIEEIGSADPLLSEEETEAETIEAQPVNAQTDDSLVASGTCGDALTWTLDVEGTLTISAISSGYGPMPDFEIYLEGDPWDWIRGYTADTPWHDFKDSIKTVIIEAGVENIGENAFLNYTSLTSITLPAGVTKIGEKAFSGCTSLTSITLLAGLTKIDYRAFSGCTSLTSITLPAGVTEIDGAFSGCTSLTSITLPASVTEIGDGTFSGCTSLTSITLPAGLTYIGWNTFADCSSLTSITLPASLTWIGLNAFSGCTSLTSITLPAGLTYIGWSAFADCSSLSNVYYEGSRENCNKIKIDEYNDSLTDANIIFGIDDKDLKDASVTGISAKTYTGKAITQSPVVKLGDTILKLNIDFTVEYSNNINVGTATVTITGIGEYTGTIKRTFEIVSSTSAVTKVSLDKKSADLATTKTLQLKATVDPADATDKTITWTSSDPSVATVSSSGLVKALKYGKATITAKSSNGKTATCKIQTRFVDVNNAGKSYYTPVYWAVDKGITVCTVTFRPDDPVTRGEFVAFLWRVAGKPKSSAKVSFKDVNSKTKFYDAIRWAVGKGIIKGYSDGGAVIFIGYF